MLSKAKILGFVGEKILDQIIDGSIGEMMEEATKQKLLQEYQKIKVEIEDNLLKQNMDESYYENLQKLLSETRIIDIIFNFSYMFCELSKEERDKYINSYIDDFFIGKIIDRTDISIIKGKLVQQYNYCFYNINRPDEKSRKIINQISLQIANKSSEQKKVMETLKCEIRDITIILDEIIKMLSSNNIDLIYLHDVVGVSLENLKGRFSRDFNVDVELSEWLNKYCNTDINKEKLFKEIGEMQKAIGQISIVDNKDLLQNINKLLKQIRKDEAFEYDLLKDEIEKFISDTDHAIKKKYENSEKDYYQSNEYYSWRHLCSVDYELDEYRKAMLSDVFIITGEAGVGKSHSIAQFINNSYYLDKKPCIFLLGQHLNENVDPMNMIERCLHLPYTLQSFLDELNTFAVNENIEIPFIIEGINEGLYSEIWKEYLPGLVSIFSQYKKIKLVISIRKTYIKKCLPEGYDKRESTLIIEHKGFENNTLDAITAFFEYYEISMPTFPILYSDFNNPLFLHTICKTIQGSGKKVIDEYSSFTDVFENYIKVVEKVVAKKCNYRENLKLVQNVVNSVIKYSLDNNARYGIEIAIFYKIVGESVAAFGIRQVDFVQAMIDSGLFYTELYGYEKEAEYVQFAYERYHNIISAQYLLKDINTSEELQDCILNGKIHECFTKHQAGIIEELFVQIPKKYKIELLELLPEEEAIKVLEPYLNSLVWRKGTDINIESTRSLINRYIIGRKWYFELLLNKFFIIAPIENHPLNAFRLHNYLSQFQMADRDSFWIKIVTNDVRYNGVLINLLRLSKRQSNMYSKETKHLILLFLSWTLACTKNDYREDAIRTMVGLLVNELDIASLVLKDFSEIDDGYIKEGVYCVVYGAVLRSSNLTSAEELGNVVYEDIFEKKEVYPHVIIRAHAKGILDYLSYRNVKIDRDLSNINPPYNSKWYEEIPTDEEIEAYKFDYRDGDFTREMYCVNSIISSMATNTGKSAGGYGDFGRYIFEGWVEPWEYHFVAQELSNVVVKIIMNQYGYDYKKHADFDTRVENYNRHDYNCERIGKKYQRIASFEMLARLSDNFEPGEVERVYSEAYSERSHRELVRLLQYRWDDSEEDEELEDVTADDYEESEDEELEDAIVAENEQIEEDAKIVFIPYRYEGPWQFGYRGIDPTVLAEHVKEKKNLWENIWKIPETSLNKWACVESKEPDLNDILFLKYNKEDFVTVEMYNTWKSEVKMLGEEPKEYFIKALAILVPDEYDIHSKEKNGIREFAEGSNFSETYTIFGREFYWSEAYKSYERQCQKEYDEDMEDKDEKAINIGIDYHCPNSYSEQIESVISSYSIPSKYFVDEMNLEQLEDGKWFNQNGELIAVNAALDGYHAALLIRKTALLQLIADNKLKVAWGIYTEKKEDNVHYETRKIAQWCGEDLTVEQYQEEKWTGRE